MQRYQFSQSWENLDWCSYKETLRIVCALWLFSLFALQFWGTHPALCVKEVDIVGILETHIHLTENQTVFMQVPQTTTAFTLQPLCGLRPLAV